MFFELHDENKIGYKELSDADLGRAQRSKQTHIGLFDDVLTFLPNSISIKDAMVIYDGKTEVLPLHFDRIQNPDGSFRSPKIRAGVNSDESVLSFIRSTVRQVLPNGTWYLFWFGLKSGQPVFLIFENGSQTYNDFCDFGIVLSKKVKSRLTPTHHSFSDLINYLGRVVNVSGVEYAEELELMALAEKKKGSSVRKYNFAKAQARSAKIGYEGERLIDLFFEDQKQRGLIADYTWNNQDGESGLAYDFAVDRLDGGTFYLDVKTTDYRFEQKMLFSSQEVEFASEYRDDYYVYRVYCAEDGARFLKICCDIDGLFRTINSTTNEYKAAVDEFAHIQTVKLAISPIHSCFDVSEAIELTSN